MKLNGVFSKTMSFFYPTINTTEYLTALPTPISEDYPLRKHQENKLYRRLRRGNCQILLYGPGGSGKTHMARNLFYRLNSDYARVAWVEYGTDMRTALTVAFPEFDYVEDFDLRFSKIVRKLAEKPKETIIFIDDVKENASNDDILTRITGLGITIFMTSRCHKIPPYETCQIEEITTNECVELFYHYYQFDKKRKHIKAISNISKLLDNNVFAMLLLARVIGSERNLDNQTRKLGAELRSATNDSEKLMRYIGHLLNISKLNSREKKVLKCFALMPSGETPPYVCHWFNLTKEEASLLVEKGWLQYNTQNDSYILHDLVREYWEYIGIPEDIILEFLQTFTKVGYFLEEDSDEDVQYKLDIALRALEYISPTCRGYAKAYLRLGKVYYQRNKYAQALSFYSIALNSAINQKDFPVDELTSIYWNLGLVYDDCAKYSQALDCYHRVEAYLNNEQNEGALEYAWLWNNLGVTYSNMGDFARALDYHQKALDIKEREQGHHHSDTAASYNNIGALYSEHGDYKKALHYFQIALEIMKEMPSLDPIDIAGSYNNIGNCYSGLGQSDKALEYYQNALSILMQNVDSDHPDIATCYSNLGNIYNDKGDQKTAFDYLGKALNILTKLVGTNHPNVAKIYDSFGDAYSNLEDYRMALRYYERALEIREKVLGNNPSEIVFSCNNIGTTYCDMNEYENALRYFQKALGVFEKTLGIDHTDIVAVYNNIGNIYVTRNDYSKALETYQKALEIIEQKTDGYHQFAAMSYGNISNLYYHLKDYEKSLSYGVIALRVFQMTLGDEHIDTQKALAILKNRFAEQYPTQDFDNWLSVQ